MIEWHDKYAQLQDEILVSTAAMTKASDGVKLAVQVVESAHQRSSSAIATILGSSYSLADFGFYSIAFMVLVVAGWSEHVRHARVPAFLLYTCCIWAERSVLIWIAPNMKVLIMDLSCVIKKWSTGMCIVLQYSFGSGRLI